MSRLAAAIADRIRENESGNHVKDFTRAIIARGLSGNTKEAAEIAVQRWGSESKAARIAKAAVGSLTVGSSDLVGAEKVTASQFFAAVDSGTILGRLGLREVPFDTRMLIAGDGATASWVGEGRAVPVSLADFSGISLKPLKVAALSVQSKELLQSVDPTAESAISAALIKAVRDQLDASFIDPANAGVTDISPASITNGVSAIPSSGNDAAAIHTDIMALAGAFTGDWSRAAIVMHHKTALALGLLLAMAGRSSILDVRWVVSGNVPTDIVVLIDAGDVAFALGPGSIKTSQQGALEMRDDPTNSAATGVATTMVSLWQSNAVAIMALRECNWRTVRDGAVVVLDNVQWGQPASSG